MSAVIVLVLLSTLLPLAAAGAAKWGFDGYDNHDPRAWLARQTGFRARAHAAQGNSWEALTLYLPGVVLAIARGAEPALLLPLAAIFLLARIAYLYCYITDRPTTRSGVWLVGMVVTLWTYIAAV